MKEERIDDYLDLIQKLLRCREGEEHHILNKNLELIDIGLVKTMAKVAEVLADQESQDDANFLILLAQAIAENFNLSPSNQLAFLLKVLQAINNTDGDIEMIYPLLQENLDKLNSNFSLVLSNWITVNFLDVNSDLSPDIGLLVCTFSDIIKDFQLGERATNLEIAITGYELAKKIFSKKDKKWAMLQNNLGTAYCNRIYGDLGENVEKAIDSFKLGLEVYTFKAFPKDWAMLQNNLGNAYCKWIRGDRLENIELAINAFQNALRVYTMDKFSSQWALIQSNLGITYRNRVQGELAKNLELAIQCYQAALQVFTFKSFPKYWADVQNNLGIAYLYRIQGNRDFNQETALNAFKRVTSFYTKETYPEQWAAVQNNLAVTYYKRILGKRTENFERAINCYNQALEIRTIQAFPEKWARTHNNLAGVYRDLEKNDEAISHLRESLKIYTSNIYPFECFQTARNLGNIAVELEQWVEAINAFTSSIEGVDKIRNWGLSDQRKQEILSEAIDVYINIVQAYIKNCQPDKALEYIERSKARNLVELLATRDLYPKGNIPETVLDELKRLRRELVAEQRRLDIADLNGLEDMIPSADQPMLDSAAWLKNRDRLNQLLQQLDNLITTEIDPIDPNFKTAQQVKPISYNEIQNLVDDRTAIVEWYINDDNFHTFIITHQSQHPKVWSSSTEERQAFLDWQEEYLQDYQQNREQWIEKLLDRLYRLSEILHIDDIINSLPSNGDQIILIPHRFLHLIPLHALPLSQHPCLIDRFPRGVRYAPSCQLLQLTQNQERSNFERLLAIQNPTKDLGYTTVEVGTIQRYFSNADVFVEDTAKKAALVQVKIKDDGTREVIQNSQLSLANCAHFSCHGEFNFESPLDSALLFADGERLTLGEIFDLDLSQCRLVTLSACETGLTNYKILSDEYVGIPSSFLYAGSPSVVSSLWQVQDVSTAFLMIKFYQNLLSYETVAIALNQAQLWLRNLTKKELQEWIADHKISLDRTLNLHLGRRLHKISDNAKPFESPFYWAAFCAIGQ